MLIAAFFSGGNAPSDLSYRLLLDLAGGVEDSNAVRSNVGDLAVLHVNDVLGVCTRAVTLEAKYFSPMPTPVSDAERSARLAQ
mgnify:CR=1 FL=1